MILASFGGTNGLFTFLVDRQLLNATSCRTARRDPIVAQKFVFVSLILAIIMELIQQRDSLQWSIRQIIKPDKISPFVYN